MAPRLDQHAQRAHRGGDRAQHHARLPRDARDRERKRGLELSAIAGAVVGDTSILGGKGAADPGVLGVLTLAILGNGCDLPSIDPTYQQLVQGALILFAVAVDQLLRRT